MLNMTPKAALLWSLQPMYLLCYNIFHGQVSCKRYVLQCGDSLTLSFSILCETRIRPHLPKHNVRYFDFTSLPRTSRSGHCEYSPHEPI